MRSPYELMVHISFWSLETFEPFLLLFCPFPHISAVIEFCWFLFYKSPLSYYFLFLPVEAFISFFLSYYKYHILSSHLFSLSIEVVFPKYSENFHFLKMSMALNKIKLYSLAGQSKSSPRICLKYFLVPFPQPNDFPSALLLHPSKCFLLVKVQFKHHLVETHSTPVNNYCFFYIVTASLI